MSKVLLPLVLAFATASVAAQGDRGENAVALLENVRQVLLAQALDDGVSLVSHGYIDNSGRLVESTYFQTGTAARGVRVSSYVEELTDPIASDSSILPPMLQSDRSCAPRYATSVLVNPVSLPESLPAIVSNRQKLAKTIQDAVVSSLQGTQRWVPIAVDAAARNLSTYERFLTGIDSPLAEMVVDIELRIVAAPAGLSSQDLLSIAREGVSQLQELATNTGLFDSATRPFQYERALIEIAYTLRDASIGGQLFSFHQHYPVPQQTGLLDGPPGLGELPMMLPSDLARFSSLLDDVEDCRLARLRLTVDQADSSSTLQLNRGRTHGVQVGEQLLMSGHDLSELPDVFGTDWLADLAIGEVIEVDDVSARVRIIAGDTQPSLLLYAIPF